MQEVTERCEEQTNHRERDEIKPQPFTTVESEA